MERSVLEQSNRVCAIREATHMLMNRLTPGAQQGSRRSQTGSRSNHTPQRTRTIQSHQQLALLKLVKMYSKNLDTKRYSLSDSTWIRKEDMDNYIFYKLTRNRTRGDTHSHHISSENGLPLNIYTICGTEYFAQVMTL